MTRTPREKAAFTEGTVMGAFLFGSYVLFVAVAGGAGPWVVPLATAVTALALLLAVEA